MNPDEPKTSKHFEADFSLPEQESSKHADDTSNPAADLIRQKVHAAYAAEPDAATEALDASEINQSSNLSKHQQFIYELTESGKSLAEIQAAWKEYYAGLTDEQKHEVWQESYSAHAQASHYAAAVSGLSPEPNASTEIAEQIEYPSKPKPQAKKPSTLSRTMADLRDYALSNVNTTKKLKPMQHFQSLLFGLGVGSIVVLIFLFGLFNERFIAPFLQPSRTVSNMPIITSDTATNANPEVIIPKINVQIPVVYGENSISENVVQTALEKGVVHYADTALPGQNGNTVIVGHSSNNIFNSGKYKFAFVLLSRLEKGDTFYLQKEGKRYTYEVYEKKVIKPTDVDILAPANDKAAVATLITCDPPGTTINRLVVVGEQIYPDPGTNSPQVAQSELASQTETIPGNAPSLWSRFWQWFSS